MQRDWSSDWPVGPTSRTDQSDRPVGPTIVPCKHPVMSEVSNATVRHPQQYRQQRILYQFLILCINLTRRFYTLLVVSSLSRRRIDMTFCMFVSPSNCGMCRHWTVRSWYIGKLFTPLLGPSFWYFWAQRALQNSEYWSVNGRVKYWWGRKTFRLPTNIAALSVCLSVLPPRSFITHSHGSARVW